MQEQLEITCHPGGQAERAAPPEGHVPSDLAESLQPLGTLETRVSRKRTRPLPCDPLSIERGVRQLLADKVSGNLAGVWLLVAEHLRLGTWDLLQGWTGQAGQRVEPRLALQLVHERPW